MVPALTSGNYDATISGSNFAAFEIKAEVAVGGVTTVDAQLNVGQSCTVVK